ncbi:hypothetical protein Tco_0275713 [Tanacetum coccineum]
MEEAYKPAVQHQRRANLKIHDVIKKEVEKLLDAGLIYLSSNSPWVSPVHCVPKKGGFTVVENDENELIPTRLVTGWRVCIDYHALKCCEEPFLSKWEKESFYGLRKIMNSVFVMRRDDIPPPTTLVVVHKHITSKNLTLFQPSRQCVFLKKVEYDIVAMEKWSHMYGGLISLFLSWKVIQSGNGPEAIKSRFGGNDESMKMQKYILKQRLKGFSVSNSKGLHKGYDRFQSLLSQLEIHGAGVSTEDAWNTGNKDKENRRRSSKHEDSKALVTLDGEGVDWTSHSEDEQENYALMACSSLGSDTEREQLGDACTEIQTYTDALKKVEAQLQSKPTKSEAKSSDFNTCESNCSEETHESMPEPVVNEPKVVSQPKVWSDAPIIEEYESDIEDEHVSLPTKEQETPSFAFINTVKHCDFHEKRMAKQAELNNRMSKGSGQREIRPVWNNVQRVNHQNQFVPKAVLTRTGKIQVNTTRTSGTNTVNTARTSGTNTVNTARHNFNRQAVPTNAAWKVNTVNPIVNNARPKASFHKTLSPFRKPFNRTTALRTNFSYQKVNTVKVNAVSAIGEKGKQLLSPQQVVIGDTKDITRTKSPNTIVDQVLEISVLVLVSGYLKGKPKLGLWYPRVSSFDLESYSDSDYAGANLDRKSTTGGCQFLGRRLIWQCKKQTIVATSTTEAEYVAAANCCGQVLWIQNQMDAYEKKLIQVLKIHSDDNIANLLIKAFDDSLYEVFSVQKNLDHSDEFHGVIWVLESHWKEI